jgi:DUF971 family protein
MPTTYLTELRRLPESKSLRLVFDDGYTAEVAYDTVRGYCPCAGCQGHWAEAIRFQRPPRPVEPTTLAAVGNYGVSVHWSDGHATGIYRFDFLRRLAEEVGANDEPPERIRTEEIPR